MYYGEPQFVNPLREAMGRSRSKRRHGLMKQRIQKQRAGRSSSPVAPLGISVGTALNQKKGSSQRAGIIPQMSAAQEEMNKKAKLALIRKQRKSSSSSRQTQKPKSVMQLIQKMQANKAEPVLPAILGASAPTVIRAIKKGADPVKAYRALKTKPASDLHYAKEKIRAHHQRMRKAQQQLLAKMQGSRDLAAIKLSQQQIMALDKETRILNLQNDINAMMQAQSALAKAQTLQAQQIAGFLSAGSGVDIENEVVESLVEGAQAEGALEFEALIGNEITTPETELDAELNANPELIVEETEGATILEQAAEANVDIAPDADAPIGITPSDAVSAQQSASIEKSKAGIDQYLTPKNLLIGGVILGGLYLAIRD